MRRASTAFLCLLLASCAAIPRDANERERARTGATRLAFGAPLTLGGIGLGLGTALLALDTQKGDESRLAAPGIASALCLAVGIPLLVAGFAAFDGEPTSLVEDLRRARAEQKAAERRLKALEGTMVPTSTAAK